MNLADYIIAQLAAQGVRRIFGYPGAAILPLMEAIDRHPQVEWVLMRSESTAALAAAASARLHRRLAVCMASSGPGATNLLTGLLDAQTDRVPVLALTGLIPTWKQQRSGFQDFDQARCFGGVLPISLTCSHPDQLDGLLRDCIGHAVTNREVSHLAVPVDIQALTAREADLRYTTGSLIPALPTRMPAPETLDAFAQHLTDAPEIMIAVGPHAHGAGVAIEALAERLQAPIVTTLDAKGVIDEGHPHALGVVGIFGAAGAELGRRVLERASTVLAFGIDNPAPFVADQSGAHVRQLFACVADTVAVGHRFQHAHMLVGPLKTIAQQLTIRLLAQPANELISAAGALKQAWQAQHAAAIDLLSRPDHATFVHPQTLLDQIGQRLDVDDIIALDVGDSTVWAAQFLQLRARQAILTSNRFGTMGYCLPALIAAKLAHPEQRAIGFCGDGSLQMVLGELLTAVQYRLPIVLFVFNNAVLQRVAAQQTQPSGTTLHNPDFVALAQACGADAVALDGICDIEALLQRAFAATERPFLVDCRIGPQVQAPMSHWADPFVPLSFA